jgi:hypothetical protein
MRPKVWMSAALPFALLVLVPSVEAQQRTRDERRYEGRVQGGRPSTSEAQWLARAVQGSGRPSQTERDRLLREMRRLVPRANDLDSGGSDEFDRWFEVLSGGRGVWQRSQLPRRSFGEFFDRMAAWLGVTDGQISRDQFQRYARRFLIDGNSRPWDPPVNRILSEANRMFRSLDSDGDQRLASEEMSEELLAERGRWDADHDDLIDVEEYRSYVRNRAERLLAESNGGWAMSFRVTPLPEGLPSWFAPLDVDQDGQIGLYEWRASEWPVDLFRSLDRNGDGLLTTKETFWAIAAAHDSDDVVNPLALKLPSTFRSDNDDRRREPSRDR